MVTHNSLRGPDERVFCPAVRRHVDIALGFQERRSIQSMPAECQSFMRCDQISRRKREWIRLIALEVDGRLSSYTWTGRDYQKIWWNDASNVQPWNFES
jgi:hypothetical protein